jgi:Tfp pilus assembly protein PilN
MLEVNLLPGSTNRTSRRRAPGRASARPSSGRGRPSLDRAVAAAVALWVLTLGAIAWIHVGTSARLADLEVEVQAAVRDSARFAIQRAHGDSLAAQEAVIAQKLQVIQEIDASRFVWPHVLDEISNALPQFVWLSSVASRDAALALPRVQIEGYAGNVFALTRFMQQLEMSPFFRGTRLISSVQVDVDSRAVHHFTVHLNYQEPPADAIQTVPLFGTLARQEP